MLNLDMINKKLKIKLTSIFTSVIFIGVVIFGLIFMMDMSMDTNQYMTSKCPFSLPGNEFCPTNTLAVTIHHISAYQTFSNILFSKSILLVMLLTITFSILFWLFGRQMLLKLNLYLSFLAKHRIKQWPPSCKLNNITKWLALFENSPSFSYKT